MSKRKPGVYFEDDENGIKLWDATERMLSAAISVAKILGTPDQEHQLKNIWWRMQNPRSVEIGQLSMMVSENVAQLTFNLAEEKVGAQSRNRPN